MFFNHQHHHQSWLNHTLVNNWSYTEYIPVVALYLMNMYMEVYYVQRDTWSIQFVAWQELSCQQGNTSVQLFINRGTPTVLCRKTLTSRGIPNLNSRSHTFCIYGSYNNPSIRYWKEQLNIVAIWHITIKYQPSILSTPFHEILCKLQPIECTCPGSTV